MLEGVLLRMRLGTFALCSEIIEPVHCLIECVRFVRIGEETANACQFEGFLKGVRLLIICPQTPDVFVGVARVRE